jgi:hypothetical protein
MDTNDVKKVAREAVQLAAADHKERTRNIVCWNMYNSDVSTSDTDYLNKYGDAYLPAKVPFNSIVYDNIQWIVSNYIARPFIFNVKAVDKYSLRSKHRAKILSFFHAVDEKRQATVSAIQVQIENIEAERMRIKSILEQQPENEEQQQQLMQLQQQMPLINAEFEKALYNLNKSLILTKKEIAEIEIAHKYNYKDLVEIKAKKILLSLKDSLAIDEINKECFTEATVTGDPNLLVDYDTESKKFIYKNIPGHSVFKMGGNSEGYSDLGDVQVITEYLSLSNVISKYGKYLSNNEIKDIKNYTPQVAGINQYAYNQYTGKYEWGGGENSQQTNILVRTVYIKTAESLDYIVSPTSWDPNLCYYKKKKEKDKPKKNQKEIRKFINKTYECTVINDEYFINPKARTEQDKALRLFEDPSYAQLPIIGYSFNKTNRSKNSLIWRTKDLQALYNILDYHIEYQVAVAGTKTLLMDRSQIPDMDISDWERERKLGVAWIETVNRELGQRRGASNFNQWSVYDMSISPSIQYLEQIKQNIRIAVDNISGVSRQARGNTTQYDGARTSELAIESSSVITNIEYWKFDLLVKRALLRLLRLKAKIDGNKANIIQYLDDEENIGLEEVPANLVNLSDLELVLKNNNEEIRKMRMLEQFVMASYQRAESSLSDLMTTLNSKTVNEMEEKMKYFAEKTISLKKEEQQNAIDANERIKQFEAELKKELEQQKLQIEQYKIKIDEMKVHLEDANKKAELALKDKEISNNTYTKVLDILAEHEIETSMVEEQKRSNSISELLDAVKMGLDGEKIKSNERREKMKIGNMEHLNNN